MRSQEEEISTLLIMVLEMTGKLNEDGKFSFEDTELSIVELDKSDEFPDNDIVILLFDRNTQFEVNIICRAYNTPSAFFAVLYSDNNCDPDHLAIETPNLDKVITWFNAPRAVLVC